jgi:hypothetical protein
MFIELELEKYNSQIYYYNYFVLPKDRDLLLSASKDFKYVFQSFFLYFHYHNTPTNILYNDNLFLVDLLLMLSDFLPANIFSVLASHNMFHVKLLDAIFFLYAQNDHIKFNHPLKEFFHYLIKYFKISNY